MNLYIDKDGNAQTIYSDDLRDVAQSLGVAETRRASHVEPCGGGWTADLTPVGGPVLGPFPTRRQALDEELAWLDAAMGRAPLTRN